MVNNYIAPNFKLDGFNCPNCDAFAHQRWYNQLSSGQREGNSLTHGPIAKKLSVSFCSKCGNYSLWLDERMIYPISSIAPLPVEEMPKDVKEDFLEARRIVNESPRGACALLRLALEKLLHDIGEPGKKIDHNISVLVGKGIPSKIQKAMDSVRIIGNEAVHPGLIDLKDDKDTAIVLFTLLNVIVDVIIVQEKKINSMYEMLPESKKEGIENRDRKWKK